MTPGKGSALLPLDLRFASETMNRSARKNATRDAYDAADHVDHKKTLEHMVIFLGATVTSYNGVTVTAEI